jgi:hypothetical protein
MCVDVDDSGAVFNGRIKWHPLERVLQAWLDMIEKGKVVVDREYGGDAEPWRLVSYSETMLHETVDVFNFLVAEIESRLPRDNNDTSRDTSPLIEEAILDGANPRRDFAYQFARKAKRPTFRYIAPGLEIATASSVTEQPFASLQGDNTVNMRGRCLPLLLFCATEGTSLFMAPERRDNKPNGPDSPFGYPFNRVEKYPAGLYLSCTDDSSDDAHGDECKLVLPFRIGAKGYARTSDGSRFGENKDEPVFGGSGDTFTDMYQPGHLPFSDTHKTRLFSVLSNWLKMVRRGDWRLARKE